MVQESITVLKSVASSSELAPDVMERLEQLVAALLSRNYTGANAAQTVCATEYSEFISPSLSIFPSHDYLLFYCLHRLWRIRIGASTRTGSKA